jgi:cleavage and polyadenylation specificity factor subunit 3
MGRLKSALKSRYAEREENINIYTPKNCEIVKLHFRGEVRLKTLLWLTRTLAVSTLVLRYMSHLYFLSFVFTRCPHLTLLLLSFQTIGSLASKYPTENQIVTGILVSKDFQFNIISANDLKEFSGIATSSILQKQSISYRASFSLLKYHLEQMFGVLEDIKKNDEVVGLKVCLKNRD